MNYDVKNLALAAAGKLKIEWANNQMKVLNLIKARFKKEKPLKGVRVAACLHVTSETANLMITLKEGGADIILCASNPLSTQDEVAASLVKDYGIATFAIKGEDNATYYRHLEAALQNKPQMTMDDGADVVSMIHSKRKDLLKYIIGGTEETTTGVIRLKAMEVDGVLKYPIIAVNDANTKHMFDNRYGTGQSTIDGIIRATNVLLAGSNFVVCGYGWCGRGAAMRAKGMGANVYVTEVDPLKAIEANMDGFMVVDSVTAAKIGDIFVTLTGDVDVLTDKHFKVMKDGAIICNSGHFNVEINLPKLKNISKNIRQMREFVEEYTLKNGKKVFVLGDGRLINLAAAEGHPASVMDMSFANQALSAEFMKKNAKKLKNKVYSVPKNIDENIASLKLKSMGITIDTLTKRQKEYLSSWQEGT
ncbi:MAG: adenosylhomocysteinase [Candidatus Firestonebacteria bacterium RIFOXYC2_FULL_39_67]|nr:MAG: adenosylhomocysteinase [Candidatus Firestonebacteria bacterium RIFOXYD2_FULL_39_29]OGF53381.1 MAG: adenosylhomocysteinase [Candidatus Firestonebacteria bacterium RIFOXYC2_FULL_39_67]OGF57908.1 MAG: adenosylhomocysteinase [Candidatus Firestonebacteria bacterium RifOxyC12_full_39_7]